jgi:hypothetical protein
MGMCCGTASRSCSSSRAIGALSAMMVYQHSWPANFALRAPCSSSEKQNKIGRRGACGQCGQAGALHRGKAVALGSAGLSKRLWASRWLVQGRCGLVGDGLVRWANGLA